MHSKSIEAYTSEASGDWWVTWPVTTVNSTLAIDEPTVRFLATFSVFNSVVNFWLLTESSPIAALDNHVQVDVLRNSEFRILKANIDVLLEPEHVSQ